MGKKSRNERRKHNRIKQKLCQHYQPVEEAVEKEYEIKRHKSNICMKTAAPPAETSCSAKSLVGDKDSTHKCCDESREKDGSFQHVHRLESQNEAAQKEEFQKADTNSKRDSVHNMEKEDNVTHPMKSAAIPEQCSMVAGKEPNAQKQELANTANNSVNIFKAATRERKRIDFVYPVLQDKPCQQADQHTHTPHRLFSFSKSVQHEDGAWTSPTAITAASLHTANGKTTSFTTSINDIFKKKKQRLSGEESREKQEIKNNRDSNQFQNVLGAIRKVNGIAKEVNGSLKQPIVQLSTKTRFDSVDVAKTTSAIKVSLISTSTAKPQDQVHSEIITLQLSYGETSVKDALLDKTGNRPRSNSTDFELNLPQRGLCEERAVLATHTWRSSNILSSRGWKLSEASKKSGPPGLHNLGNTCFLNATLQCLSYLPTFCQCITSLSLSSSSTTGSNGQKIILMMRSLLRKIHFLDVDDGKFGGAISPKGIVNAMPMLGGTKRRFRVGRQEDAHEFLVHLLDAMKDGELIEAGIRPQESGWRDRLPIARLDETTLIHRMFGGYFRSQVRCTNCEYRSNTYDPFLDLSLEVSKGNMNSLSSAIGYFTRKEKLDTRNQWKCGGCKQRVCATKQFTIFRPPLTLCIQLKRFTYGGGHSGNSFGYGGGAGQKICKPIQFPVSLSLPLSDKRKCEYDLNGVIVHVGGSSNSGHYMAYIKKLIQVDKTTGTSIYQWYHMDDSYVSTVSENKVLQQSNAYVLFYCRKEVKLEFPTPPARSNMSAAEASQSGKDRARGRADSLASNCSQIGTAGSSLSTETVKSSSTAGDNEVLDFLSRHSTEPCLNVFSGDDKRSSVLNTAFSNNRQAHTKIVLDHGSQMGKVDVAMGCHMKSDGSETFRLKFGSEISQKKKMKQLKNVLEYSSSEQNRSQKARSKKHQMLDNGHAKGIVPPWTNTKKPFKQHGKTAPYRKGSFPKHKGARGSRKWKT